MVRGLFKDLRHSPLNSSSQRVSSLHPLLHVSEGDISQMPANEILPLILKPFFKESSSVNGGRKAASISLLQSLRAKKDPLRTALQQIIMGALADGA